MLRGKAQEFFPTMRRTGLHLGHFKQCLSPNERQTTVFQIGVD